MGESELAERSVTPYLEVTFVTELPARWHDQSVEQDICGWRGKVGSGGVGSGANRDLSA